VGAEGAVKTTAKPPREAKDAKMLALTLGVLGVLAVFFNRRCAPSETA
jgi:hypothetical protein